ncbi:MAG: glycosyltransferase family 2 protein [Oscillospiraceae bacterium]|nr:glycosyltransferase family 2 protein [Oscillospiraceae bacterium]
MLFNTVCTVLLIFLKAFSLWFAITAVFCLMRPKSFARSQAKTRFACLIPARNEEAVIGDIVRSLTSQRYPRELFDVYVIPNNCTDGTQEAALAAGAKIITCSGQVTCKGDALRQAVDRLLIMDYDAFCIFDADNIVHHDFLSRMNDAVCAGARVAKARMSAKNPYDTAVTGCYGIYYSLFDSVFNRARANIGLSAKLVGTGFAVHRQVLEKLGGWHTRTIAEDAEFSAICAQLGERVFWVPEAVTYDEAPRTFRTSVTQRMRWSSGVMSVAQKKLPGLICGIFKTNFLRCTDCVLFLCAPYVQILSMLLTVCRIVSELLTGGETGIIAPLLTAAGIGAAGMLTLAVVLAIMGGMKDRRIVKSVLLFPLFMASWMPIQIVSLVHRTRNWHEIRHIGVIDAQPGFKSVRDSGELYRTGILKQ